MELIFHMFFLLFKEYTKPKQNSINNCYNIKGFKK